MDNRTIRPANGIGPVTTPGAKAQAEKRSAQEYRKQKKAEREWPSPPPEAQACHE